MTALGVTIFVASAMVACVQAVMSWRLVVALRKTPLPLLADDECPDLLAVLCLRGTDPFLPRSLQQLFAQDYPNYRVRVVIDSEDDPAKPLVEDVIKQTGVNHVDVVVLDHRDKHCSAKMSSLLQATADLPEQTQVVATFDGDALLHPSCLRELVTPLRADDVQVTTGNRWFAPAVLSRGAVGRFQWNLACVPLMHAMGLPWGGCLAMKREIISDPDLRDLYAHAFAEDILLGGFMTRRNQAVRFVPRATIVNREDLSLGGLLNFLTRQMLCVRLHHHQWKRILGYGILMGLLYGVICPLGLLVPSLRWWCLAGLVMMLSVLTTAMALQGKAVRRLLATRDERLIPITPLVLLKLLLMSPLTQFVTLVANLKALFAHQITWRGLTYRFGREPIVTLVNEVSVADLGHEYTGIADDVMAHTEMSSETVQQAATS